jgi:transcriptional regulator GlxA family with amidase domain
VCTGSLLLTRAGLLEGKRATTHWAALDELEALGGGVTVVRGARWVDDGVISSAGVSAGIDMAFYVVEKLLGKEVADRTARYIDYPRGSAAAVS